MGAICVYFAARHEGFNLLYTNCGRTFQHERLKIGTVAKNQHFDAISNVLAPFFDRRAKGKCSLHRKELN
jgi:hypothetical protein